MTFQQLTGVLAVTFEPARAGAARRLVVPQDANRPALRAAFLVSLYAQPQQITVRFPEGAETPDAPDAEPSPEGTP